MRARAFAEPLLTGQPLIRSVMITGAALVVAGALLLASELGRPFKAVRSFSNAGTSWMARGAVWNLLLVVLVVALLVVEQAGNRGLSLVTALLTLVLALLVAAYPGLLLFASRDIGLWRSVWLPLLFFAYSLTGGASLLVLFDVARALRLGFSLSGLALLLTVLAGALFALYCAVVARSRAAGVAHGWRQLIRGELRGPFVGGGIALGLILPLFCFIDFAFLAQDTGAWIGAVGAVGFLAGAYVVRYCLLRAACHEPLGFLSRAS